VSTFDDVGVRCSFSGTCIITLEQRTLTMKRTHISRLLIFIRLLRLISIGVNFGRFFYRSLLYVITSSLLLKIYLTDECQHFSLWRGENHPTNYVNLLPLGIHHPLLVIMTLSTIHVYFNIIYNTGEHFTNDTFCFDLQLKYVKNSKSSEKRNVNKYVAKRMPLIFSAIPGPVFSSNCTARSKTPNDSVSFQTIYEY